MVETLFQIVQNKVQFVRKTIVFSSETKPKNHKSTYILEEQFNPMYIPIYFLDLPHENTEK